MSVDLTIRVLLPAALAVVMLGLGLGLVPDDFRRVVRAPRALAIGLAGQFVGLPLAALAVVAAFPLEPALAAGLVITSLCPGGITSNAFSHLARADVALSVTLTAVISLLAPFTIPVLAPLLAGEAVGARPIVLDPMTTLRTLLLFTVVPVAIGMAARAIWPAPVIRLERFVGPLSLLLLALTIGLIAWENRDTLGEYVARIGLAAVAMNLAGTALGWFAAHAGGLPMRQCATIAIEVGVQNTTLAMLITGVLLNDAAMTVAPAVYGLLMFPIAFAFVAWVRRRPELAPAPA